VLAFIAVLRRPTIWNVAALAAVTCGLEYSHYWAFFLVAATAIAPLSSPDPALTRTAAAPHLSGWPAGNVCIRSVGPDFPFPACSTRARLGLRRRTSRRSFTPSLSSPVETLTRAGRLLSCSRSWALLAIFGSALDSRRVVLDLRTRPGVRGLALLSGGTLLMAVIAGKLTGSTFADRYSAVILTPCLLVVAYGVTALTDRRVRQGVVAVAVVLGLAGIDPERLPHKDAGRAGCVRGARPRSSWDVVAYCPESARPSREP